MIRTALIQRKVLDLYQKMDVIRFPVRPDDLLTCIPYRCRILSYHDMAIAASCSEKDVAIMCSSNAGATHYDIDNDRYLILYNEQTNSGRCLWTICHEIGHICMEHLQTMKCAEIAYKGGVDPYDQCENEADYFSWNTIAPLPILRNMGIRSADEIRTRFGMSTQAATLHYNRYAKWCRSHIKTAWENQILREFHTKYQES